MRSRVTEIIFGIGSFFLGGIIGAIIENELTSGFNAAYFAVLILAITLFTVTVIALSASKDQVAHNRKLLHSFAGIEKRLGLKVSYQELKDIGKKNADHDDLLARLMREANYEILEVSRSEVHQPKINPDLPPSEIRLEYYDSIIKRVETQSAKGIDFVYKRIIQFPQANGTFCSLSDNTYVDHCKKMVILQQSKGVRAYVKRTLVISPTSFLIIDRQNLIITLDAIRHLDGVSEQHQKAELIIYDPQQELIQVFLREWDRIENSPYTQTATIDEFK